MATYLDSSARAVGNAMRTNPFAPEVPCHRVLAADGSLGGYKGEWKVSGHIGDGSFRDEKRIRLKEEGVVFDQAGKASGDCFMAFEDLGEKVILCLFCFLVFGRSLWLFLYKYVTSSGCVMINELHAVFDILTMSGDSISRRKISP